MKCRNFKACCESGGTEKRRDALRTTSRHGTLLILPSRLPQIHSALAATAQRNLTPFGRAPMPPCSSNRGRPGMQIAFLPGGYRPCHPLPAPTALVLWNTGRFGDFAIQVGAGFGVFEGQKL